MKKKFFLTLLGCMFSLMVMAQIPGTISYQGYLTDATGKPKSGTHTLTFKFYDGASVVVTKIITNVQVTDGLFTVIIGKDASGDNSALSLTVWSKPITVGITVDAEAELPKITLTSVPYAFSAQVANSVDGANVTGNISASKISGVLVAGNIPNHDAAKITSGTIDNARLDADLQDLADGSLSGSKVGSGIAVANITGTLPGTQVGTGISATNVTTGTLLSSVLDADIADLGDGTLTSLNVDGFSKLGSDAPIVKMKKLTGTTNASEGGETIITHGLTASKIISVTVMVAASANFVIHESYVNDIEYQFNWYLTSTDVRVYNAPGNSGNILSKPIKILITYEQ